MYTSNLECRTVVRFPQGQRVSLEFLSFDLEGYSNCIFDWMEIRDGDDETANLIGQKLCGDQIPDPMTA